MSGSNDRVEIQTFLEEEFGLVTEDGAVATVDLQHHAHSGPVEMHNMKVGHGKWGKPDEMAATFDALAVRHAKGIVGGGAQQYELSVCRGTSGRPSSVLPFVRVGSSNITGPSGSLATEPPTPIGQLQQGMRMGEQVVQGMIGQINPTFRVQGELIDRLMRRLSECDQENRELWIACKDLILDLQKTRHAEKLTELNAARMAEFQKQAMTLAPALLNMMAGREVFPLSTADTAILDSIAGWASAEDIRMITGALATKEGGPAIASSLTDRFDLYHKRKAAEATAEKRMLEGLPKRTYEEAENDAAGDAMRVLRGTDHRPHKVIQETAGNGVSHPTPAAAPAVDEKLWDDLFASVPESMVEMLATTLAGDKPELAERIQARFELFKAAKR
jgi:hypothetical protein